MDDRILMFLCHFLNKSNVGVGFREVESDFHRNMAKKICTPLFV